MEEYDQALCAHYGKMLGLEEGWEVTSVDLSVEKMRLELAVGWVCSGAVCPECGTTLRLSGGGDAWMRWVLKRKFCREPRERTAKSMGFCK